MNFRRNSEQKGAASFKELPLWEKILSLSMVILSPILMIWLSILGFSNQSFDELYIWSLSFRVLILVMIVFCIGMPAFFGIDLIIAHKRAIVKKFPSKTLWAMSIIGIILPFTLFSIVTVKTPVQTDNYKPELLIADGTGIYGIPDLAVSFWSTTNCTNTVAWGTNPNNLNNSFTESIPGQQHAIMLKNLLPSTTYFYQINYGHLYNFTTASNKNDTLKFAVGSDSHFGRPASNTTATVKMLKMIASPSEDNNMFFFTGDMVQLGFEDYMWTEAINTMSPYTSHIPFRPLLGNHDTLMGGIKTFEQYFYPTGMEEQSTNSRAYYHILINNINFFCLDLEWGNSSNSAAQMNWFKSELAKIPAGSWIIVMSHCFFYSSGPYEDGMWWNDNQGMIETFAPLFQQYHVQMVFSGHNHQLEALEDNGTYYFVNGGFGGLPSPNRDAVGTGSLWYLSGHYGYIETNINGNVANVTFLSPEGAVYNSFLVNKY